MFICCVYFAPLDSAREVDDADDEIQQSVRYDMYELTVPSIARTDGLLDPWCRMTDTTTFNNLDGS